MRHFTSGSSTFFNVIKLLTRKGGFLPDDLGVAPVHGGLSAIRTLPAIFALLVAMTSCAHAGLSVNDNTAPPYLGVIDSTGPGIGTDAFAAWLHRTTIWGNGVFAGGKGSSWNSLSLASAADWFLKPASVFMQESPGRTIVVGVPLLPGPTDGSGPADGPGAGQRVSLTVGATGAYNGYFRSMGENLVAAHLGNCVLRIGWEFNGDWYTWKVSNPADAASFAAYWKQIVDTLRTVPGQNFRFLWGGALTYVGPKPPFQLEDAYPAGTDAAGRPYVDFVGVDVYDENWTLYPWPSSATPEQIEGARTRVWQEMVLSRTDWWGIPIWDAIAREHHVPLTIPEWGLSTDAHGGQDNTAFVQKMYDYIQDPANNVYFAAYYDAEGSKISPVNGYVTKLVKGAALYRALFALPPVTKQR